MQELLTYLASISRGSVADTAMLEGLLAACWEQFEGSNAEGMAGDKLCGRMEDVVWRPPILRFMIERHGATVLGSTRAERHAWKIDLENRSASCEKVGYRQVSPRQSRLNVEPMAEEIVQLIMAHQEDERLKWRVDGSVWVQIGRILPQYSAVKQTLAARRTRFRATVDLLLHNAGWRKVRPNVYTPPDT